VAGVVVRPKPLPALARNTLHCSAKGCGATALLASCGERNNPAAAVSSFPVAFPASRPALPIALPAALPAAFATPSMGVSEGAREGGSVSGNYE
jgi:hypothetical protein